MRRTVAVGATLVILAALGAVLWLGRWQLVERRAGGDAFWYARSAFLLAGSSDDDATRGAAEVMVRYRGQPAEGWLAAPDTVDARYEAIFRARPLYPAVAAPFVASLGPDALVAAALVGGIALAVAVAWVGLLISGSWWTGALASVLVFVLPSGAFVAYLAPEGWMLAAWTVGLGAAVLHLDRPRARMLAVLAVAIAVISVTKSANAGVLAVALVAVAVIASARKVPMRRAAVGAAATASSVFVASVVAGAALGLPGLTESVQDLLTDHFTKPDVASPWLELVLLDARQVPRWALGLLRAPVELGLVVAGAISLARYGGERAFPWLVGGAATVLVVFAHPVTSEIPRLLAPIWVAVALGLAAATARGIAMVRGRALRPAAR